MDTIRFEREDMDLFARASHDRNPLHVSTQFARKSIFGDPVVFGILGVLKVLGKISNHLPNDLQSATVNFQHALFVDVDYTLELNSGKQGQIKVKVTEAGTSMFTATLVYRTPTEEDVGTVASAVSRLEPATWDKLVLQAGLTVEGHYAPDPDAFRSLLSRCQLPPTGNAASPLVALLLSSYLVGMEFPGERAMFTRLKARVNARPLQSCLPISYFATVTSLHDEFSLLETSVTLAAGALPIGELELSAFVRPESPTLDLGKLTAALPASAAMHGKRAMVIGGSRGLGAAIVAALASQGCDVYLNYFSSTAEAEALVKSLPIGWGNIHLLQGDASDASWCRRAEQTLAETGGLDILVCNAVPSIRILPFGLQSIGRVRMFLDTSIALVATPLAGCRELLEASRGVALIVSSVFADPSYTAVPDDLHHYVASKAAIEGLVRSLATDSGRARYCVARPPRLLTDQTNTPMARSGSLPVETVAGAIVMRLSAFESLDRYSVLNDFGS